MFIKHDLKKLHDIAKPVLADLYHGYYGEDREAAMDDVRRAYFDGLRLKYDLSDLAERGKGTLGFIEVTAGSHGVYEYIKTNQSGEGRWLGSSQIAGTCQYSLPVSKAAVRRELRKLWMRKALTEDEIYDAAGKQFWDD